MGKIPGTHERSNFHQLGGVGGLETYRLVHVVRDLDITGTVRHSFLELRTNCLDIELLGDEKTKPNFDNSKHSSRDEPSSPEQTCHDPLCQALECTGQLCCCSLCLPTPHQSFATCLRLGGELCLAHSEC